MVFTEGVVVVGDVGMEASEALTGAGGEVMRWLGSGPAWMLRSSVSTS